MELSLRRKALYRYFVMPLQKRALYRYLAISLALISFDVALFLYFAGREGQTEYLNLIDATYWVTSTITTVGYGDIVLTSAGGKIFTMFVQLTGICMVFGILISFIITPWFEKTMEIPLPVRAPPGMKDHIIICGYNRLVETLIQELSEQKVDFLIIEEDGERVRDLLKRKLACMSGSPTEDSTLKAANIDKARFLIANREDARNANIALTASNLADVYIIAVAEDPSNIKYLKYAGARRVISPKLVLGRAFGNRAVDPCLGNVGEATKFFEGYSIAEFPLYPGNGLVGKTLASSGIQETGAVIIGMRRGGVLSFEVNPSEVITDNCVLLAVGTLEQLSGLKKLTHGGAICRMAT